MESQLKKGFLDMIVLVSLYREPSYGYKIIQDLSIVTEITESTLYPVLKRLEIQSLVDVYTLEVSGRLRKYYRITFAGKVKVKEFKYDCLGVEKMINYIKEHS